MLFKVIAEIIEFSDITKKTGRLAHRHVVNKQKVQADYLTTLDLKWAPLLIIPHKYSKHDMSKVMDAYSKQSEYSFYHLTPSKAA